MHVMAVSAVERNNDFWSALKKAHARLPKGAEWSLAVASADGTRAVNVIVHDSVADVEKLFEEHAGAFARTEFFEADATNAVGLAK